MRNAPEWLPYVVGMAAAVFGIAVGRWLEAVTYRKPDELDVRHPGSRWWVPVAMGLVCALVTHRIWLVPDDAVHGWPDALVLTPTLLLVVLSCTCLAAMDLDVHRLPDRIVWPTMGFLAAGQALAALMGAGHEPWLRAVLAGLAFGGFFMAVALVCLARGSLAIGLGDVKVAVVVGASVGWFGWSEALAGIYVGFMVGGIAQVVLLLARRVSWDGHFAYATAMMIGALVGLLWGPHLLTSWV